MKGPEKAKLTGKRAEAYEHLEAARSLFHEADREDLVDAVADIMDVVCGWCGPHARVEFADEKDEPSERPDGSGGA